MKIKTIIIDDERLARNELKKLLKQYEEIEIIDEAISVNDAITKINHHNPDLIFLDIQMPGGKTGFDLLELLDYSPVVVFTTAYNEFAIRAFQYNALDYLQKPIDTNRLTETIQKILQKIEQTDSGGQQKLNEESQVFVKDGEKCWFVKLKEIRLFESVGNYAKVYFGKEKPLILKSLNSLEERLNTKIFFRANRKYIINLESIQKIDTHINGGLKVILNGGEEIEISRRQSVKFKDMMSL
ncbi:MAG TPA: response regulator [Chitinophagaceae bacterium]|nr:response regulator [Chitinophagaceae bacterium]